MTTPNLDYKPLGGSLYCLTAYFNPLGLTSRYENFQVFYQRMMQHNANLLIAEASLHDRGFQLPEIVNAEQLPVQVCADNILWHKENLLSLLLNHLPDDCYKVCWIDCDVLYQTGDWQAEIFDALQKFRIVQGFSFAGMLPKGVEFIDSIDLNSFPTRFDDCSKVYGYLCGLMHPQIKQANGHPGFVWAARREVLEEINFYNECIMGGGDLLMSRAAVFQQYSGEVCDRHSRFQLASYFPWAQLCTEAIDFSIGFIPNVIYHLYHGSVGNRNDSQRWQGLRVLDFDPRRDIEMTEEGLWKLTEEGKRLEVPVQSFFASRKDDET
jgi:hypothetical protein